MTSDVIELAKPAIDAGLMTNMLEPTADLFVDLGLSFDHLLKLGGGIHQHRYTCGQSVIKLNSHRSPLAPAVSGYTRLRLATNVDTSTSIVTPDGVDITAVPPGHDGIVGVEVTWRTARPTEVARFLAALGAHPDGDRHRLGESWIVVDAVKEQPDTGAFDARGFRYLTVQVRDVERAHSHMCSLGFAEGRPPIRLGDTAYISFIRDADGNWIELSQRASLTGPLPDVAPERHHR